MDDLSSYLLNNQDLSDNFLEIGFHSNPSLSLSLESGRNPIFSKSDNRVNNFSSTIPCSPNSSNYPRPNSKRMPLSRISDNNDFSQKKIPLSCASTYNTGDYSYINNRDGQQRNVEDSIRTNVSTPQRPSNCNISHTNNNYNASSSSSSSISSSSKASSETYRSLAFRFVFQNII